MSHPSILSIILAGGKGERLFPLTALRSKPSVPFAGRYRIIDFVLSNMINSQIFSNYLLVQYKSQSLIDHIRKNWVLTPILRSHFITIVPPQMRMGKEWYKGTADAVFQNKNLITDHNPELVTVFGADHIYRMDVRQMIDFHLKSDAHATVAAMPVPIKLASSFGVIHCEADGRITGFLEKPKHPPHMPGDPTKALVSLGNYVFHRDILLEALATSQRRDQNDFGTHIMPSLVETHRVFAYDFATNVIPGIKPYEEVGYWRDVGTIKAFFDAHMDLLGAKPRLDLNNPKWPINTGTHYGASAMIVKGNIRNSIISEGTVVDGAKIINSIIRRGVRLEKGAVVENSIIMDNVHIKKKAKLSNVIVDKNNVVEEGTVIGTDPNIDRFHCHIDPCGIAVVPKGGKLKPPKPAK